MFAILISMLRKLRECFSNRLYVFIDSTTLSDYLMWVHLLPWFQVTHSCKSNLTLTLHLARCEPPAFLSINLPLICCSQWGLAAIYASQAYNNSQILTIAESVWNDTSLHQISIAQANENLNFTGSHRRLTKISGSCDNRQWFSTSTWYAGDTEVADSQ